MRSRGEDPALVGLEELCETTSLAVGQLLEREGNGQSGRWRGSGCRSWAVAGLGDDPMVIVHMGKGVTTWPERTDAVVGLQRYWGLKVQTMPGTASGRSKSRSGLRSAAHSRLIKRTSPGTT